jgi:hypothetical protein
MGCWQVHSDYRLDQDKLLQWLKQTFKDQQDFHLKVSRLELERLLILALTKLVHSMSAATSSSISLENLPLCVLRLVLVLNCAVEC